MFNYRLSNRRRVGFPGRFLSEMIGLPIRGHSAALRPFQSTSPCPGIYRFTDSVTDSWFAPWPVHNGRFIGPSRSNPRAPHACRRIYPWNVVTGWVSGTLGGARLYLTPVPASPVPPSVPKCWVNGDEETGSPVPLRCTSSQGSMPLTYQWKRRDGGTLPSMATQSEWDIPTSSSSAILPIFNYPRTFLLRSKEPLSRQHCRTPLSIFY